MKQLFVIYCFVFILGCSSKNTQSENIQLINYDSLNTLLEEVYLADQIVRGNSQYNNVKSEIVEYFDYDMHRVDEYNQSIFLDIMNTCGWPHDSLLSREAEDALFLVLQHSPSEIMETYFPVFKSTKGITGQTAMMEDRILMRQGKKQIYGTQASSVLREDGAMAIWPIEDPQNVNLLRQNLFSTTIEEYAEILGADYDPEEELP